MTYAGHAIEIERVWIHPVSDPSACLGFREHKVVQAEYRGQGEVRQYANGRLRSVSTPSTLRFFDVSVGFSDREDIETLTSWAKQTVCLRDPKGRKIYGTFFSMAVNSFGHRRLERMVSFQLQEISFDEEIA